MPGLENRNITMKQREDENKLSFKKKSIEEASQDPGNRAPTNYISNDPYADN